MLKITKADVPLKTIIEFHSKLYHNVPPANLETTEGHFIVGHDSFESIREFGCVCCGWLSPSADGFSHRELKLLKHTLTGLINLQMS